MPELRWILLLLGIAFVVGLGWWELRRARRTRPAPLSGPLEHAPELHPEPAARPAREPSLTLPEIRIPERTDALPVLEVADEAVLGLRIEEPMSATDHRVQPAESPSASEPPAPESPDGEPVATTHAPAEPIVDWPPEGQRRIIAVRLVSTSAERFSGRALRQALAAEGFLPGKLDIFHRPDEEGRAVLSAASLAKPGTFDLGLMDAQRFPGLFLFAVLPGPLTPADAFDQLVASARNLNQRVRGALQDEHGAPLEGARVHEIRAALVHETERSVPGMREAKRAP